MSIKAVPANKRSIDLGERFINVVAPLIAYPQTPRVLLPAEGTLRHPAEPV